MLLSDIAAFASYAELLMMMVMLQVTYVDCCDIVAACKSAGVILAVCHVLRYTSQACKIAELLQSGCIGDVVTIQHTEPVSTFIFLICSFICYLLLSFMNVVVSIVSASICIVISFVE